MTTMQQTEGLPQRAAERLTVLRHELQLGETRLQQLGRETAVLQDTVLRISGAIQVLEEILAADSTEEPAVLPAQT